ncbi:MAG: NfeD family protein [Candidatus Sericytochromatia bacterium]|nr:NfeD family protein [Candidatus Sericytochromatia bacterium]
MSPGTLWVVAAAVLFALEMVTGEFTLASLAVGCALAAGAASLGLSLGVQVGTAATASLVATAVLAPWLRRKLAPPCTPDPIQSLVGEEAEVVAVAASGTTGTVRLNGVTWQATADSPLTPGMRVLVMEVNGARLRVLPAEASGAEVATREPTSRGEAFPPMAQPDQGTQGPSTPP